MADGVKVRIATQSARELELEVEDGDAVAKMVEAALAGNDHIVWITDTKGHRHGVLIEKVAFVEVESAEERPEVGF